MLTPGTSEPQEVLCTCHRSAVCVRQEGRWPGRSSSISCSPHLLFPAGFLNLAGPGGEGVAMGRQGGPPQAVSAPRRQWGWDVASFPATPAWPLLWEETPRLGGGEAQAFLTQKDSGYAQ